MSHYFAFRLMMMTNSKYDHTFWRISVYGPE